MVEIGARVRGIELQRIVEDSVSEWRERSARVIRASPPYRANVNFRRHINNRRNSAEINRILTKLSQQTRNGAHESIPNKSNDPPTRPTRRKRDKLNFFNKNRISGSKSEMDLSTIKSLNDDSSFKPGRLTFDFGKYNYQARSCDTLNEEVSMENRFKSENFEENSILLPRTALDVFPDVDIAAKVLAEEEYQGVREYERSPKSVFRRNSLVEIRGSYKHIGNKSTLKRNTCPDIEKKSGDDSGFVDGVICDDSFEKCGNYKSVTLNRGDNKSSNIPSDCCGETKGGGAASLKAGAKRRWRMLRPKKSTFECFVRWRGCRVHKSNDKGIQQVDDGFFEKFGSLLKQQSLKDALNESTPLAPLVEPPKEVAEEQLVAADGSSASVGATLDTTRASDSDSGNETLQDSDSEPGDPEKIELYEQAVGWNIDELYSEILYEILHHVGGCDVSLEVGQLSMLTYVQEAFHVSNDKHQALLNEAESKEPPDIMLNVEVVEAKELPAKDANGLSDPFVTMYLMSNSAHRYNTSVKSGTLSPVWEEHFSLPVPDNLTEDSLCLEMWDFDPAETVKEKMTKIFEFKGVKGLRKLMKEIVVTASTGKHDNELIGRANIPLKTVPANGLTMWYSLDKKNKLKRQGVVKLRLGFSSEKNSQVASQEHRHLLRVLLLHELDNSKVAPYWWCGNFNTQADAIITQHSAQSGLGQLENYLCQWTVYCAVNADHPLNFSLFNNLLDKLIKPLQSGTVHEEEVKLFWDAVRRLLPTCFSLIRKLRKKTAGDNAVVKMLKEVLKILNKISTMDVPANIELFPQSIYGWLRRSEDGEKCTITEVLSQAATQGASDWFVHILDSNECRDVSEEGRLQHLVRVIQLVRSDLQRAVEYYDRIFLEMMNFPYARCLYALYESKIASLVEPEVVEVCKSLKQLQYDEASAGGVTLAGGLNGGTQLGAPQVAGEPMAMGTTLFELYLVLQRFLTLGQGLNPADWQSYSITKFHSWFFGGVAAWLDIAVFKALTRIGKAVELDRLVPVDATVKYSSSGVDTLAIFYQIKVFWQQLAWPDVEGCYTFVAKIIDDICRCCVYYAKEMAARVGGLGESSTVYERYKFEVTSEWCLAINNIDYVRQSLEPFVSELGMEDIIKDMCELRSPLEAQRCKQTLQNVIENAIDTVRNKILELLEIMVKKMMPSITRFLVEGAELLHRDCSSMERVMLYLEENLDTLYANLNQENFGRTLDTVWEQLSEVLYQLIQTNLEKRRPPSFFANLHECLRIMLKSFKQDNAEAPPCATLQRVQFLLQLHGLETAELVQQAHLQRWQQQQAATEAPLGLLTVRAKFHDNDLKLEIMNARNLVPTDSNGLCDSYVRVSLLPEDIFVNTLKPKTQTHNKNLFPLYDEVFTIALSSEQRSLKDGLVQFVVKDKDLFSVSNQFMGEAYLHFSEVPDTPAPLSSLPQVHLTLTRPSELEGDAMKALETRQGDKQARDFLKKQKQKLPT